VTVTVDWTYLTSKLGDIPEKGWHVLYEIVHAAAAAGHKVRFLWGEGPDPDHNRNRLGFTVADIMVDSHEAGQFVRDYTWKHRARFGLKHVIWDQRITSTVNQPGVVRVMADRGNPTKNHKDHNHLELFPGDYVPLEGGTHGDAPKVDKFLDVDGELGPKTVSKWQSIVGSTVDGVISRPKSELIYWVQRYLRDRVDSRLVADGELGPLTTRAIQRYLGAPLSGTMDRTTVIALQRRLNEQRF
jgi:hypothetical protein